MAFKINKLYRYLPLLLLVSCKQKPVAVNAPATAPLPVKKTICCESKIPSRFASLSGSYISPADFNSSTKIADHPGMVWIKPGNFMMGADNRQAAPDEYPKHKVTVAGFWMDTTEVTNAAFAKFVKATGYITTAERKPDWNELQKQVAPGTPKPPDSLLVAASLVFSPPDHQIDLNDYSQWWAWVKGADWKHPHGPGSNIKARGITRLCICHGMTL